MQDNMAQLHHLEPWRKSIWIQTFSRNKHLVNVATVHGEVNSKNSDVSAQQAIKRQAFAVQYYHSNILKTLIK